MNSFKLYRDKITKLPLEGLGVLKAKILGRCETGVELLYKINNDADGEDVKVTASGGKTVIVVFRDKKVFKGFKYFIKDVWINSKHIYDIREDDSHVYQRIYAYARMYTGYANGWFPEVAKEVTPNNYEVLLNSLDKGITLFRSPMGGFTIGIYDTPAKQKFSIVYLDEHNTVDITLLNALSWFINTDDNKHTIPLHMLIKYHVEAYLIRKWDV